VPDLPFRIADPWLLGLLALVAACWLLTRRLRRRSPGALLISSVAPLRGARPSWRIRSRWLLTPLRALAACLLVLALARPQVGKASARIPAQGIDIVIALDVSGSMLDAGLSAGTKLDGAKRAIKEFIAGRKNDRVGVVIFESESRVVSPLTLDYRQLQQIVDKVSNGLLRDGTAIGLGIADSANLLRESRARSKVIILATDGENNQHRLEPDDAVKIAQQALKVKLYTIGLVQQGAPSSAVGVDEGLMKRLAEQTGGSYARATTGDQLHKIFDHISRLETSQVERQHYTKFDELAGWFIVPAIGLLALEVTLAGTVFRRAP